LSVPADAPVQAVLVRRPFYDRATHAFDPGHADIQAAPRTSVGLQANADGSIDVYFSPRLRRAREIELGSHEPNGQFESLASTGRRSRFSTRRGSYPISRRFGPMIEENVSVEKYRAQILAGLVLATTSHAGFAQTQPAPQSRRATPSPVTVDNFIRAESDLYFGGILKDSGAIGKFLHRREPARIENQTVIASTATRSIRRPFSISTPDRSRSRCPTPARGSCRCRSSMKIITRRKSSMARAATR